jgi:hypothetical protein
MTQRDITGAGTAATATAPRWPRAVLLLAAVIELLRGLSALPVLFGNLSEVPGPGLGGAIVALEIVLHPVLALAALSYLIRGRMAEALLAFAGMILLSWLSLLPSVAIHGFELHSGGVIAVHLIFQIFLAPFLAAAVATLAIRQKRVPLAAALAALPTGLYVLGVAAFGLSVAIYGF